MTNQKRLLRTVPDMDPHAVAIAEELQARERMCEQTVADYAEAYEAGAKLPPVDLYQDDDGVLYIGDGNHRTYGARRAGVTYAANVYEGGKEAAMWAAAAANARHGLRRTNADKRRAVRMAMEVAPDASNADISRHCNVHHSVVAAVRADLTECHNEAGNEVSRCANAHLDTRKGGDGKEYPATADAAAEQRERILDYLAENPQASLRNVALVIGCSPSTVSATVNAQESGEPEAPEPEAEPEPEHESEAPEEPRDAVGQTIPPEIRHLWEEAYRLKEIRRAALDVRRMVRQLCSEGHTLAADIREHYCDEALSNIATQCRNCVPYAVCHMCHGLLPGRECKTCGGKGYLGQRQYENLRDIEVAQGVDEPEGE